MQKNGMVLSGANCQYMKMSLLFCLVLTAKGVIPLVPVANQPPLSDTKIELELELIQSQMAQKPMLRGEVRRLTTVTGRYHTTATI